MRYVVFITQSDQSGRIDLADTTDSQAASDLAAALVSAGSGKGFDVGVQISPDNTPPAGGTPATASARGGANPPARR